MKINLYWLAVLAIALPLKAIENTPTVSNSPIPQSIICDPVLLNPQTDDPQPDTIKYCNPAGGWLLVGVQNIWAGTRFTPIADFELRAVYIQVVNPNNVGARCYVHVMNAIPGGAPIGTSLGSNYFQQPPSQQWIYVELETPILFESNEEFFIVYGPTPAGSYPSGGGYWPSMDDAPTGTRNYYATGAGQNPPSVWEGCVYGDFMIMAGGEYSVTPTDLEANNVFTAAKKYWVRPGYYVNLKATVKNVGMTNVATYLAHWEARNDQNVCVFSADGVFGPLNMFSTQSITCPEVWEPAAIGTHTIVFDIDALDDFNLSNDTTKSEIYITNSEDMPFSYVHEPVSGDYNFAEIGITFNIPDPPMGVDSIHVFMNDDADGCIFNIYSNDAFTGQPCGSLWQTIMDVDSGWVTLYPGLYLYDDYFTVAYSGGSPLSRTQSGLNSAGNDSMMTTAWVYDGGWEKLYTGDWPFIAYLSDQGIPPPFPVIVLSDSSIDFGNVSVGDTGYFDLTIYNQNYDVDLIISQFSFNAPGGLFGINDFTPLQHILPMDSAVFELWFCPSEVQIYNYQMYILNNSSPPILLVPVMGNGTLGVCGDNSDKPLTYELAQNNPNPFNPTTNITYSIPENAYVTLSVYNVMGEEIANLVDDYKSAGSHTLVFDASGLSSGVYFYKINAGEFTEMKKMVLMK